jgi:hypothetical protein
MNDPDDLEGHPGRALHRVLRELPSRRAPAVLETRVLAELVRRADLPWWRLGFAHWPPGARLAFLAACTAIVGGTVPGVPWALSGPLAGYDALLRAWMEPAIAPLSSAPGWAAVVLRAISPVWLYGGVAAAAALYATLFALGAAGYSTLYLQASTRTDPSVQAGPRVQAHP